MATAVPKLNEPSLLRQNACYVNGEWVAAASGETFEVKDPATGKVIATCSGFGADDTSKAVGAAEAALGSFRRRTGRERARLLRRWFDLATEHATDLATLITWENGKPTADAKAEVTYAAGFLEWFGEEAARAYGTAVPATVAGNRVVATREPVGVCALVTPWNFPAAMLTRKMGPALAAGCAVVCKAPSEAPLTALALAELSRRAGVPPGVVNVVTAAPGDATAAVGALLATDPRVRKLSFTGSTAVGRLLMRQSADTLKKLSLELGGNAPLVVFDDADLDAAVAGAVASKFRSSGQTCVCANRLYVQRPVHDEFARRLADAVAAFRVGNGFAPGVTHGPLIHARAVAKARDHVRDAVAKGAEVVVGGDPMPDLGESFFQPTVLTGLTADMRLAREETFGPVAGLFAFDSEAELVRLANDSDVGLAAYVFSRDLQRVARVAEALDVGMVGVNTGVISDPAAPFGGVKQSGFGREGSLYGIHEYQVIKTITYGSMSGELQGS